MSKRIDIDKMSLEVVRMLNAYQDVTIDIMTRAVKETAKETVQELNLTSPEGATGDYKKSWAYKRDRTLKGSRRFDMVVYSKKPDYRLTHLLEKGHAKVNGGRVQGKPHIAPAEKNAIARLETKIKRYIREVKEE